VIEPGRYTVILEPQAVADLVMAIMRNALSLEQAERGTNAFSEIGGGTKIGRKVMDERISLISDPMDPDGGFVPFSTSLGLPHRRTVWVENGVLRHLSYDREHAIRKLGRDDWLLNPLAVRMTGGTDTIDDMIRSTRRGLLVTRFQGVFPVDMRSLLCSGSTRDGVWLVENGVVKHPVKNFRFNESPIFVLNNIEQLGQPERVHGMQVVVPSVKARDFSFTSIVDAV
jgi:predicted Zn-dependent protease